MNLTNETQVNSRCRILHLDPILGSEGTLRVGGRLQSSNFYMDKKYPILLSTKHILFF